MNGNAIRDSPATIDTPIVGVMVDLFNCNTGAQEGSTTTNKDGYYALSISEKYLSEDTTSKNCYYIQFTATTSTSTTTTDDDTTTTTNGIMDTSVFTTPLNGETLDIYVGRGESILNVDAGINMQEMDGGSDTFTEWNDSTYFPTFAPTNSMGMEEEDAMGESAESSSSTVVFPTPSPTLGGGQMNDEMVIEDEEEGEGIDSELLDETESATTTTTTTADEQTNHENMILLRSSVRLQLSNIDTRMDRDALSLFESVCATFLNSQIIENDSSAVSSSSSSSSSSQFSLYDLNCNVLRQEIVEQEAERVRRRRGLRLGRSTAETTTTANDDSSGSNSSSSSRSLNIRVRVMGYTDKTSSVQDATDVKFRDVLVKTFNEYGDQFTDALKEESALLASTSSSSTSSSSSAESALETAEYFEPLGTVRFGVSSQGNNGNGGGGNASGAQSSSSSDGGDSSSGNKGIVAAIIVCLVLGTGIWVGLFMVMKRRKKIDQVNQSTESNAGTAGGDMSNTNFNGSGEDDGGGGGDGRNSSLDSVVGSSMAIFKAFPRVPRFNTDSPPCTPPSNITAASSFSPNSMCSYVGSDGEVEIVEDDSSLLLEDHPNAPIRRDVMAPPGKLGLLVTGDASTAEFGLGPSIHTIQPGSPMVGLLHIGDRIVSINDVDTREFSAEEIIQVMAETSGGERKITVLSDQP